MVGAPTIVFLQLWHHTKSLHQFANLLSKQLDHRHMFSQWSVDLETLEDRVMFQQPANYFSNTALQEHWWDLELPSRKLRCRPTKDDIAAFTSKKAELRRTAAEQEQRIPVSFALENRWSDTIQDDKAFYQNNTLLRMTGYFPFSPPVLPPPLSVVSPPECRQPSVS